MRISEKTDFFYSINCGVLIVEGVITLALKELFDYSLLKIHIDIENQIRRKRLYDFYIDTKGLSVEKTQHIILQREQEEVPFVKNLAKNADCIYK